MTENQIPLVKALMDWQDHWATTAEVDAAYAAWRAEHVDASSGNLIAVTMLIAMTEVAYRALVGTGYDVEEAFEEIKYAEPRALPPRRMRLRGRRRDRHRRGPRLRTVARAVLAVAKDEPGTRYGARLVLCLQTITTRATRFR